MPGIASTHLSEQDGGRLVMIARTRAAITQTQLASRMGVPQQTISRWERNQLRPSFEHVLQAVGACGWDMILALTIHGETDAQLRKPVKLRTVPAPRPAAVELLGVDGAHPGERRMQGMKMMRRRRAQLRTRSEQLD